MRITIELSEKQRAELFRLAAKRGLKGLSHLVQEALTEYLRNESEKLRLIEAALSLKGSFQGAAADEFEQTTQTLRKNW